jgi:deoxyadenosine/deoxycytidine kinase
MHILKESAKYYEHEMLAATAKGHVAIVSERCVGSAVNFIEAYFQMNMFTPFCYTWMIEHLKEEVNKSGMNSPDCYIFLDTSPENARKRIMERKRLFEYTPLDSLTFTQKLDVCYRRYIKSRDAPVVSFNTNGKSIESVTKEIAEFITDITANYKPM